MSAAEWPDAVGYPYWIPAGIGYDTHDGNFARLADAVPVRIASEFSHGGHVIAYQPDGTRMHVGKRYLIERAPK